MTATRFRPFALAALALGLGVALVMAAVWYLPSASLAPGRSVSWKLGYFGGHPFGPSTAMTTTVVQIEVDHPSCIPSSGESWFDVTTSYTPVSVTIQVRMTPEAAASCPALAPRPDGGLPPVGGYLTGVFYAVQLREPLGGRALFDGFTFPAAARPYP